LVLIKDSGWAELLRSFGTQTSAGIKYDGPRITKCASFNFSMFYTEHGCP